MSKERMLRWELLMINTFAENMSPCNAVAAARFHLPDAARYVSR
jgi:hypothetical protein